jgi:hypothetical protein
MDRTQPRNIDRESANTGETKRYEHRRQTLMIRQWMEHSTEAKMDKVQTLERQKGTNIEGRIA